MKLAKSQLTRLIEIVTGQNYLNYMRSKTFKDEEEELCRFCEEESETFDHLLVFCPVFWRERAKLFKGGLALENETWDPGGIVEFSREIRIDDAMNQRW